MQKCKNCRLYNKSHSVCEITVLIEGEKYELPVRANDDCHWERVNREIQEELENKIKDPYFKKKYGDEIDKELELKQIRIWADDKNRYIESSE